MTQKHHIQDKNLKSSSEKIYVDKCSACSATTRGDKTLYTHTKMNAQSSGLKRNGPQSRVNGADTKTRLCAFRKGHAA